MMGESTLEETITSRPRTVLLAEDDEELRKLLADSLRAEGFTVTECPNGLALVETLVSGLEGEGRSFDLIVSDVRLPGVTGLSVLEGLYEWDQLGSVPVVLITAFGEPRVHEFARRFGAVSVLEKPFEMAALMSVVREVIDGCDSGSVHP